MSSPLSRLRASSVIPFSRVRTPRARDGGRWAWRLGLLAFAVSPHAAQAQTYGTISPGSLTTTAPTQAYTIDACSVDDGVLLRPTMFSVALDGVAISPAAITPVTVAGCYDAYQITGTAPLVQGQPNRLSTRVVAWGNHSAVDTATYTYHFIKPFVFTNDTWGSTRPGITSTKSFTVRNTGNVTGTITVSSNCSGLLSSCESPSPTSVTLAPMAQQDITVPYHSALTGGAGGLTVHATGVDGTALTDQLTEPLAVDAPVAWLLVTPRPSDGASADVIPGYTVPVPFSLANYGGNYSETVQLVPTCTAAGSPVTCTISPASVDLGIGVTAGVQVLLAAPNAAGVSGTISLVGTVAGTSVTSLGSYTYTTAVNTQHFSLQIATDTVVLAPEKTKTLIGQLSNASASSDAYSFTATHCDSLAVASCPAPATTGAVASGGNTPFTLTFRASTHLGQQGAVTLVAASTVVTSSTNVAVIPVRTRDRYVVMPRTASLTVAANADSVVYFSLQQQSPTGHGFTVQVNCPAIVTCTTNAWV